jgi:hypothetical protein
MSEGGLVCANCAQCVISLAYNDHIFEECHSSVERNAIGVYGTVRLAMNRCQRKSVIDNLSKESVHIRQHVSCVVSWTKTIQETSYF